MLNQHRVINFSRILAGLFALIGGFWIISLYTLLGKTEISTSVLIILTFLHLIGALSGVLAKTVGILGMIIFTGLSLFFFYFGNLPVYPPFYLGLIYLILIIAQTILLFVHFKVKISFDQNITDI